MMGAMAVIVVAAVTVMAMMVEMALIVVAAVIVSIISQPFKARQRYEANDEPKEGEEDKSEACNARTMEEARHGG